MGDFDTAGEAAAQMDAFFASLDDPAIAEVRRHADDLMVTFTEVRPGVDAGLRSWYVLRVAGVFNDLGLLHRSRGILRSWLIAGEERGSPSLRAMGWSLLAGTELEFGNGRGALQAAHEAAGELEGSLTPGDIALRADAIGMQARVWIELGDLEVAANLLAKQRKLLVGSRDEASLLAACRDRAELYLADDRPSRTLSELDKLKLAHPDSCIDVIRGVAEMQLALLGKGDAARAFAILQHALDTPGLNQTYATRARLSLLELALHEHEPDRAQQALRGEQAAPGQAPGNGSRTQTSNELEGLASRFLLLRQRSQAVPRHILETQWQRLAEAFEALLGEFRRFPIADRGHAFLSYDSRRRVVGQLIELTRQLWPERAAAIAAQILLDIESLTTPVHQRGLHTVTVDDVERNVLAPGEGVALFMLSVNTAHLVLLDHDRPPVLFTLPGERDLRGRLFAFRSKLDLGAAGDRDDALAELQAASRDLVRALLPPALQERLRRLSMLTIADHGTFYGLPWEALVLDDGRLLGETVAINNLSSLPLAAQARRRPGRTAGTLELLGTVHRPAGARKASFAFPRAAAEQLAHHYARARLWIDGGATLSHLLRHGMTASVTQIIAHGARSPDVSSHRGLQLADGVLSYGDVARLPRVSGVVILSSCDVGLGRRRLGDEPWSGTLGGALLRAGASAVVQARDALTLGPHLELLDVVHAHLARGEPIAEALRAARETMRRTQPRLRFQHAELQVFGLGYLTP